MLHMHVVGLSNCVCLHAHTLSCSLQVVYMNPHITVIKITAYMNKQSIQNIILRITNIISRKLNIQSGYELIWPSMNGKQHLHVTPHKLNACVYRIILKY